MQSPLPIPAVKWRLPHGHSCPRAEQKPSGESKGMLEGLQVAAGSCRRGCNPPLSLLSASKGPSTNAVLTRMSLDIFFLTLPPAFHLGLRQPCKALFPETLPPANS